MDLQALVAQYGLIAVLLGCVLEGETILLLAAASAHTGLLDLRAVVAVAAIGAFIGDNLFFFLGRRWGSHVAEHLPWIARVVPRVDRLLERWRWGAVIVLRFTYGLRTGGPMLLGAGKMPTWEFVSANALGAVIWAAVIGAIGFAAGQAVEALLGRVSGAEKLLLVLVVAVGVGAIVVRTIARRRMSRPQ
ncbi:MAG TPA: DedA family protein [Burkholderiaceae bacterium]|nr:DedA family protein [Burkholderiaceae bacterium]